MGRLETYPMGMRPICWRERVEGTKGPSCRLQRALHPRRVRGARKVDVKLLHQHLLPTRSEQRRTAQSICVGTLHTCSVGALGHLFSENAHCKRVDVVYLVHNKCFNYMILYKKR